MDLVHRKSDWLFIVAAFFASSLIFLIQTIIAKQLLPTLGGAPAVWTACMLFFQTCLLVGYAWAHLGPRLLGDRGHAIVHILLLLSMAAFLPIGLRVDGHADANPAIGVLKLLAVSIGVPMCILSATSPLLQRWHASINPSRGDRVYRLYSIGNIASLIVLLGYPLLIEPFATVSQQRVGWSILLAVLAVALICAAVLRVKDRSIVENSSEIDAPVSRWMWLIWIVLSAVPSSYLLGVTSYLTSDVAAVPFLWVLPLAMYLGAFSLAFAGKSLPSFVRNAVAPALGLLCLVLIGAGWTTMSVLGTVLLHAGTFFLVCTGCLCELYRRRPAQSRLTSFYLWIAVGGVFGGVFNSLLAPILFSSTVEYPIALLACASLAIKWPAKVTDGEVRKPINWLYAGMVLVVLIAAGTYAAQDSRLRFGFNANWVMLAMGVPMVLCYIVRRRPVAFAFCTATLSGTLLAMGVSGRDAIETRRSFFGVHRVTTGEVAGTTFIELYHGTTLHGRQTFDTQTRKPVRSDLPVTYYHPDGPLGTVIRSLKPKHLSVLGLGIGGIAAYIGEGQTIQFFEIDPAVIDLAEHSEYFSFLSDSRARGATIDIVKGDGRLTLRDTPARQTNLLILDAFSGDAVPTHLLTREAFAMYADRLTGDGTLAVHISNQYLDLRQVVANNAALVGGTVLIRDESKTPEVENTVGRAATIWIVITRNPTLADLLRERKWVDLKPDGKTIWTDDYSSFFGVLK